MRAAIAGDIIGSRFERSCWSGGSFEEATCHGYDVADPRGNGVGESASTFELFHADCHLTDDTVLTLAVIDWLLKGGELEPHLRSRFRACGRPELFGKVFREWASRDTVEPGNSFGNGAAMRVAPVGYARDSLGEVRELARRSARCTHQSPDAVLGAEAIAAGVFLARTGESKEAIERALMAILELPPALPLDEVRPGYRFSSRCPDTVPIAIRAFVEASDYEGTVRRAVSVGGDSDTIACMAGALAGAFWGTPTVVRSHVAAFLDAEQLDLLLEFEDHYPAAARTIF
jgi:ADP-ribosyl-[dinitrogen reductase] hydrolase